MKHIRVLKSRLNSAWATNAKLLFMALLLSVFFSCDQAKDAKNKDAGPADGKIKDKKEMPKLPDFALECSHNSARFGKRPRIMLADTEESFNTMYIIMHSNKVVRPAVPEINMDKFNVFLLYGGILRQTYQTLVISDYKEEKNTLNLKIHIEESSPASKRTNKFSTPYCLIKIKKDVKNILIDTEIENFQKLINVKETQIFGTRTNKRDELDYVPEKKRRIDF